MIRLHPVTDSIHKCPYCQVSLEVKGWYIPGMRNLADLKCPDCGREYYGDLLSGQALYTPLLLDKKTGVVNDKFGVGWFTRLLHDSYINRTSKPIGFTTEVFHPLNDAILLNCLDVFYGHSLLKLLNAQYYLDHYPDKSLIIIVPRFLRWLVPDGVAAVWTVDLPLKHGSQWNDWLAGEIKHRIESLKSCHLSIALSHPHPTEFDIINFSRISPFSREQWEVNLKSPKITFIWREDRCWGDKNSDNIAYRLVKHTRYGSRWLKNDRARKQRHLVIKLADILRSKYPDIDFSVVGLGEKGRFPGWIKDMRESIIDEKIEKKWCERYAESHLVIGIHGSNMLLPSAHAGGVIDLMPPDRWGNMLQDVLFSDLDSREQLFFNRFIPDTTGPEETAEIIISILSHRGLFLLNMGKKYCTHEVSPEEINGIRHELSSKENSI